jgi:hypothetical protein
MNHLSRRGINPSTFWGWAMGGDMRDTMPAAELRSWVRSFRAAGLGVALCLAPSLAHAESPQTRVDASLSSDREAEALFCILEASFERSATKREFRSLYHECAARRSEYLAERAP